MPLAVEPDILGVPELVGTRVGTAVMPRRLGVERGAE